MPEKQTFTFLWNGIEVSVSVASDWLNSETVHLEIRAPEKLPITETGYRSHFMPMEIWHAVEDVETLITNWLEEEAKSKAWKAHWEDRKQLKLF